MAHQYIATTLYLHNAPTIMNEYIKSDLYRYTGKTSRAAFWKLWLSEKKFRWQVGMRICQKLHGGGVFSENARQNIMENGLHLAV